MNTLKHILSYLLLMVAMHAMADNVTVADIEVTPGGSAELVINFSTSATNITGYQMSLYLPTGVTLQKDEDDDYAYTLSSRHNKNHTFSVNEQADGGLMLVCYSLTKKTIAAGSGELLRLPLSVAATATGTLTAQLRTVKVSDTSSNVTQLDDVAFNIIIKASEPEPVATQVSVADIDATSVDNPEIVIDFATSATDITGYQMSLYLPEGVTLQKDDDEDYIYTLSSRHNKSHTFSVNEQADGGLMLVCYSLTKKTIAAGSGELLRLPINIDATATGTLTAQLRTVKISDTSSNVTQLDDVTFNIVCPDPMVKSEQTLSLTSLPVMTVGDAAYQLPSTTAEGLPLTWTSNNTSVATISNGLLMAKGAGTAIITATQAGNDNYLPFDRQFTLTVKAKPEPTTTIEPGNYLLYNVGAGQYFTKGNGWGTQASIGDEASAMNVELIAVGDNWFIRTGVNSYDYGLEHLSGGTCYTSQSRGKQSTWKFTEVSTADDLVYTILAADNHGGGGGVYLAANSENTIVGPGMDASSPYAWWKLIDLEQLKIEKLVVQLMAMADRLKEFAISNEQDNADAAQRVYASISEITNRDFSNADDVELAIDELRGVAREFIAEITLTEAIDITDWFIINPMPTANADGWSVEMGTAGNNWASNIYDPANNCAEFWQFAGARIYQPITLPAGKYSLTAQAFTRTSMTATLFAGDASMHIATVENTEVNSRTQANIWFNEGHGYNTLEFSLTQPTEINIGLLSDSQTPDYWMVWRDFNLTMMPASELTDLLGDANCDGAVDVVDVTTVVDFILGKAQATGKQFVNADVNRDQSIDVVDLTSIVSIILGTYQYNIPNEGINDTLVDVLGVRSQTLPDSDNLTIGGTSISLTNSRNYTAFQMDITLADGATLNGMRLSDRAADHSVTYSRIADNTYRIVAYSLSGTPFSGVNGSLLKLDIEGIGQLDNLQLTIENALFSDGANGYTLGFDAATGIAGMENGQMTNDELQMTNAGAVYDLSGKRVGHSASDILHSSRKGLYIVNGKTVLVK